MKKLKEIGFVKEVKGKGKYTFISDFNYVKIRCNISKEETYEKTEGI